MTALWTSQEIAEAVHGECTVNFAVEGVAFDSREVKQGDLFLALKGEASDGHLFLEKAFANGAPAAIVSRPSIGQAPMVQVHDTGEALASLALAARKRATDAVIIGITGSAGKTGTKEALFAALDRSSLGRAHRSVKSYNNHVGVPLSLARMPRDTQFGVFEMGMNHVGELSVLTGLVRPHIAIVTTIAPAHIGHFSGEEEIADAKGEIFEGLMPGGVAIIPRDNPHYERLRAKAAKHASRIISFGFHPDSDVRALDYVPAVGGGTLITASLGKRRLCYTIAAPGDHWVANSLAVLAAVDAAGGSLGSAGLALAEMEGLDGRGARHQVDVAGGKALLIDESYNANPASMRATISQLGQEPGRHIAVLGSMKELGKDSDAYHEGLAGPLLEAKVSHAILVGDEMQALHNALGRLPGHPISSMGVSNADDALTLLRQMLAVGDAVLIKGSNAIGLSKIIRSLAGERSKEEA